MQKQARGVHNASTGVCSPVPESTITTQTNPDGQPQAAPARRTLADYLRENSERMRSLGYRTSPKKAQTSAENGRVVQGEAQRAKLRAAQQRRRERERAERGAVVSATQTQPGAKSRRQSQARAQALADIGAVDLPLVTQSGETE